MICRSSNGTRRDIGVVTSHFRSNFNTVVTQIVTEAIMCYEPQSWIIAEYAALREAVNSKAPNGKYRVSKEDRDWASGYIQGTWQTFGPATGITEFAYQFNGEWFTVLKRSRSGRRTTQDLAQELGSHNFSKLRCATLYVGADKIYFET